MTRRGSRTPTAWEWSFHFITPTNSAHQRFPKSYSRRTETVPRPPSVAALAGLRSGPGTALLDWPRSADPDSFPRPWDQVSTWTVLPPRPSTFYSNRCYRLPRAIFFRRPAAAACAGLRFCHRRRFPRLPTSLVCTG